MAALKRLEAIGFTLKVVQGKYHECIIFSHKWRCHCRKFKLQNKYSTHTLKPWHFFVYNMHPLKIINRCISFPGRCLSPGSCTTRVILPTRYYFFDYAATKQLLNGRFSWQNNHSRWTFRILINHAYPSNITMVLLWSAQLPCFMPNNIAICQWLNLSCVSSVRAYFSSYSSRW